MKLKIHIIIMLLLLALCSCRLLRKERLVSKTHNQKEEGLLSKQRTSLSHQRHLVLMDSSKKEFTVMLWTKGKFRLSPANGFEGEAEKIMIAGRQYNQRILKASDISKRDSTVLKAAYTKEKDIGELVSSNRLGMGYSWAWMLLIPVVYLCYWGYRRFGG